MKSKVFVLIILLLVSGTLLLFLLNPKVYVFENEEGAKWQLLNGYIEDRAFGDTFGTEGFFYMGDDRIELISYKMSFYFLDSSNSSVRHTFGNERAGSSDPLVFEYGTHSHSKGYSGITLPGSEFNFDEIYWEVSYKLDDEEVLDVMTLKVSVGDKPEPTKYDPKVTTKEYLVSENSNEETDLLYLDQTLDEALIALDNEGIEVSYITYIDDSQSPMDGGAVINLGLFSDVMLSYSPDGNCYAITSFGYDMASGLEIGDSYLISRVKLAGEYTPDKGQEPIIYRYTRDNIESYVSFMKGDLFGRTLYGWAVYSTDS